MWPDWVFLGMLLAVVGLTIFLLWPVGKELRHAYVKRRLQKRIHREHLEYLTRQRGAKLREAVR